MHLADRTQVPIWVAPSSHPVWSPVSSPLFGDRVRPTCQADAVAMEVLFASVPVTDLPAAIFWYEQLFGRPPDIVPNQNEVMWQVTEAGWLYVLQDPERAGRTVVTISVSSLLETVEVLARRGIRPGPIEAVGDSGRKSTWIDSDGNAISLIEVTT